MGDGGDDLEILFAAADLRRAEMKIGAFVQDHIEFDTAIRPADVEYMKRSRRTLAKHQFDLEDATFILNDCAFADDELGRAECRGRGRQSVLVWGMEVTI